MFFKRTYNTNIKFVKRTVKAVKQVGESKIRLSLVDARKKMNLTQDDVAERVGISRAYLANIENGKNNPSLEVAHKLSVLFGKSINELLL